jgi:putative hydrolase of the HAD superfamily
VFAELPESSQSALFERLWRHFADPSHWTVFEDVAPAWQELERRGLVLGVASNFDSRLEAICRELSPFTTCHNVHVSSRLGWRKPSPNFFRGIQQALDLPPGEILLVGDDFDNDYRPALAAGWQSIYLQRGATVPLGGACDITTVQQLSDLLDLFAGH